MAKIRVYELAKDLNMTNKVLLEKIKAMDIDVKSHMSSLDDDIVQTIKGNLFSKGEPQKNREVRIKATVIRRRRKKVADSTEYEEGQEENDTIEQTAQDAIERPETEESQEVDVQEVASVETESPLNEEDIDLKPVEEEAPPPPVSKEKIPKDTPAKIIKAAPTETIIEETDCEEPETTAPAAIEKTEPEVQEEAVKVSEETESPSEVIPVAQKETAKPKAEEKVTKPKAPLGKEEVKVKKVKTKKKKKTTAAKIIKLPDPVDPSTIQSEAKTAPPQKEKRRGKPVDINAAPASPPSPPSPDKADRKKKKGKKGTKPETEEELRGFKKKTSFRKKAVVEGNDLYAKGRGGRKSKKKGGKAKAAEGQKTQLTTPKAIKRRVKIDETIVLAELAKRMGIKANEMITKLMSLGVMATVNQTIDYDTAALVANEFDYEVEKANFEEEILIFSEEDKTEDLSERPPVVTIMGHVDHGKTSLLDVIRKTRVADGEAGGITQHIGAYNVSTNKGQLIFLDTPGHEAFTAMRSRGAKVTDIVILVVAADDGVMPQTIEAINHSKAAEVPIIIAVNKMDKEGADPDRIKRELSDHGILAEDWGGDTIFVNVSAKQNKGIDELLEMVLLQAEMLELNANPNKLARGHVVEAKLDTGRGPVATVLIQTGTLETSQSVVCGIHYGKIRAMLTDQGKPTESAGPSIPVEILGLTGVPEAGDELIALADEKSAKQVSAHRIQKQRALELAKSSRLSLDGLFEQMKEGEVKDLNIIIRADVHGSIEAIKESLLKLSTEEINVNIIHAATGTVTESDVSLATVSNAIIFGFNVRPGANVQHFAEEEHVDMRFYTVIYDLIQDVKDAMLGLMESTYEENVLGRAEIREVFVIPKKGSIAGSYVVDGKVERGKQARLLRDGVIVFDGMIGSLRRFKDDAKEVMSGYECGIGIENYNDVKVGDIIECYNLEEIKPTMD